MIFSFKWKQTDATKHLIYCEDFEQCHFFSKLYAILSQFLVVFIATNKSSMHLKNNLFWLEIYYCRLSESCTSYSTLSSAITVYGYYNKAKSLLR